MGLRILVACAFLRVGAVRPHIEVSNSEPCGGAPRARQSTGSCMKIIKQLKAADPEGGRIVPKPDHLQEFMAQNFHFRPGDSPTPNATVIPRWNLPEVAVEKLTVVSFLILRTS